MADFLAFRRMLTPIIIQALFWISFVMVVIFGFILLAIGESAEERLAGVLTLLLGPLVLRIYTELMMLAFRINETLTEIKNNTERREQ